MCVVDLKVHVGLFKSNTGIGKVEKGGICLIARTHFDLNEREISVVNFHNASVDDVDGLLLFILCAQYCWLLLLQWPHSFAIFSFTDISRIQLLQCGVQFRTHHVTSFELRIEVKCNNLNPLSKTNPYFSNLVNWLNERLRWIIIFYNWSHGYNSLGFVSSKVETSYIYCEAVTLLVFQLINEGVFDLVLPWELE